MKPAMIGKAVLMPVCAAMAAWSYVMVLQLIASGVEYLNIEVALAVFAVSLMGNFIIGLPIALLLFFLSTNQLFGSPTTLVITVVLTVIVMILATFIFGGDAAVLVFGIPASISAMTFAVLGWHWVIKPMRVAKND